MRQVTEGGGALAAPGIPGRVQAGRAAELEVAAIAITRHAAPARVGVDVFIGNAQAQGGVGRQVVIQGAVVDLVLATGIVIEVMLALLGDHRTATQRSGLVQRAAGIDLASVVVPGSAGQAQLGLRGTLPALAHKVDATGGAARALHHPGCPAQHLDPIVVGHVTAETVGLDIGVAHVQRHTVVLILPGHAKAPGVEVLAAHGRVIDGDARGLFHDLVDGGEILVVEHLAGDHGHRLRGFPERMSALGDGHRTGGVRTAAFGRRPERLGIDVGRRQLQGRACGWTGAQHVAAVGLGLGLQSTVGENPRKPFADAIGPLQPRRLLACGLPGVERDGRARRTGESAQHLGQAAGRDIVGLHRVLRRRRGLDSRHTHAAGGQRKQANSHRARQPTRTRLVHKRHAYPPPEPSN